MNAQQAAEEAMDMRGIYQVLAKQHGVSDVYAAFRDARLLVWTSEVFGLARTGLDSFVGTHINLTEDMAVPQFWHFHNFVLPSEGRATVPLDNECLGFVLFPGPEGLLPIGVFVNPESVRTKDVFFRVVARPLRNKDIADAGQSVLLACLAFMQLKLAALEPVVLPRAVRRRMQRENKPIPNIRIVQLRQREPSGNHVGSREYHHKWIVQGHWRRLHEPRKSDGAEVTFVHAYVKGPEGAPLLQPRESVYVVAR